MALSSSMSTVSSNSSTSTPPAGASRQWRVPGPSTRYHKSEHARPKPTPRLSHTRARSSLSTRSSYNESTQSPLARLLSFGPPTHSNSNFSSPTASRNAPLTPLKSPSNSHSQSRLQGSPFSDYFTDDSHSVDQNAPYLMPPEHAQKLLLRLNNLGSDLLRYDLPSDALYEFSHRLDSLEAVLDYHDEESVTSSAREDDQAQARHAQDQANASFSASDKSQLSEVWMADACEYADCATQTINFDSPRSYDYARIAAQTIDPHPVHSCEYTSSAVQTLESDDSQTQNGTESGIWVADHCDYVDASTQTTHDRLLADTQDVVQRLAKANDSLRRRFEQSKQHNQSQSLQLEDLTRDIMALKSENDTLKADLGFDHSELLFLKLQLQAIEVQADNDRVNRVLLADDFNKWKADWDHVDARLRARRTKNRVASATSAELATLGDEAQSQSEDQGNWQLQTQKKRHGRVESITIKRLDDSEETSTPEDDETLVDHHFDVPFSPIKHLYSEQSTQTEEQLAKLQIADQKEHICSSCGEEYTSEDEDNQPSSKTPWQELCDGLVAFAGMQRD